MLKQHQKESDPTRRDNLQERQFSRPRVRSARMIRTLVMTALAALPMKACTGARQTPVERPRDGATMTTEDSSASATDRDEEPRVGSADAGGRSAPDGSGRVWRGGEDRDEGPGPSDGRTTRDDEDRGGRVWRGAPGEDRHDDDRDAWEPDDARRRRDDAPPPVPAYAVEPVPEYGIPDPIIRPMYAVEPVPEYMAPLPEPATYYGAPVPPPVAEYAVPSPDDDEFDPVLRYGLPYPR